MDRLIFVFGAHRSGTTLFKLMLDSHKDISNPGEIDFIFDHLRKHPESDKWILDIEGLRAEMALQLYNLDIVESEDGKLVASNFLTQFRRRAQGHLVFNIHRNLDKISALFPDAKIIHIIRDPRDVARSCIDMGWAGNTYFGIDLWLETETSWDYFKSIFNKNNVMELFYEALISNPAEQLDKVCRFIGVSFSPEMLSYTNRSTYEAPDPSAIQQWKKKLTARDVALVEIRVKRLLLDRRYELSGYPLDLPGLLETIYLIWTNKKYKWEFGSRRYGCFNFIMEKATRKFARPFHYFFIERMNEIGKRHLKR